MNIYDFKHTIKKSSLGEKIYLIWYMFGRMQDNKNLSKYQKKNYPEEIRKYKDIATRRRCFVIGNGPSLTLSDLEYLREEDTFAANRIYGAFKKTEWRPQYYCCQDGSVIRDVISDIDIILKDIPNIFFNFLGFLENKLPLIDMKNIHYIYSSFRQGQVNSIEFSEDCSHHLGGSMTVTYAMIQLAVYMGYKEIYLLGIDHNYSISRDQKIQNNSYADFIMKKDMSKYNLPHLDEATLAYIKAKEVCEAKNIVIKNATRGGKLEVFERITLEDIFNSRE